MTNLSNANTPNIWTQTIPDAEFILLNDVSHFAPLQRPEQFNAAILEFVAKVLPKEAGNGPSATT